MRGIAGVIIFRVLVPRLLPGNALSSRLCRILRGRASRPAGYEAEPRSQCVCLAVTLLATACGSLWGIAAGADMPESSMPTERIQHAVQKEIDAGLFPGSVVLVGRPEKVLFHEAFGHARVVPGKVQMPKHASPEDPSAMRGSSARRPMWLASAK